MERRKLSQSEIDEGLKELPGWKLKDGKLHREYKFKTFAEAIGWITTIAIFADKLDHHPDWSNTYNRVSVDLMTHDLGAISTLDLKLADKMESLSPVRG